MKPTFFTVDLFAGCGGISEGFHQAGFGTIAQVEMNESACQTLRTRQIFFELKNRHKLPIYNEYVKGNRSLEQIYSEFPDMYEAISHRVIEVTLSDESIQSVIQRIEESVRFHNPPHSVNVFLGGPPCQPYSIINRAWVRKDLEDRNKDLVKKDEIEKKNFLYRHYLELLRHFKPDLFVYENVPGLFSAMSGGEKIFQKLLEDFSDLDPSYEIIPPLDDVSKNPHSYIMNCSGFGVPQNRKRLILIGYRKDLEEKNPHIREIHAKLRHMGMLGSNKPLTVKDAISDLPSLKPGSGNNRYYDEYPEARSLNEYQIKMRRVSKSVLNHFARAHMVSDLDRYRFFIEHYNDVGKNVTLKELLKERPDLAPEHKEINFDKFVDRFKVQGWSQPSSTITSHLSKDGHYFIHPDIHQCRSFTVREAARCQSFPDNFLFEGPRTEQFRQVGNAVPPLFAKAIGRSVRHELEKIYR
jgi:DNA (cytosine-5)-methyltransferase 1